MFTTLNTRYAKQQRIIGVKLTAQKLFLLRKFMHKDICTTKLVLIKSWHFCTDSSTKLNMDAFQVVFLMTLIGGVSSCKLTPCYAV